MLFSKKEEKKENLKRNQIEISKHKSRQTGI